MDPEQSPPAALIALLASDAGVEAKARACKQLAVTGGPEAVPSLASLLSDERLADHARLALEVIPSPAAAEALRKALPALKGRLLAGAVDSLGVRREAAAVPDLIVILKDPARAAESGALAALARIATEDAIAAIRSQLKDGPADLRLPAAHAALVAADSLLRRGKKDAAKDLLGQLLAVELPAHLHEAAVKLKARAV